MLRHSLLLACLALFATQAWKLCEPSCKGQGLTRDRIARLERRMDQLKDGMSLKKAFKVLGVPKNLRPPIAHGATVYYGLSDGYSLAIPFAQPDGFTYLMLLDRDGSRLKVVRWRPSGTR